MDIKPILQYFDTQENSIGLLNEYHPNTASQLKAYQIALTEKLKALSDLDDEIILLVKEEQIDEEIKEKVVFRETIHSDIGISGKSIQMNTSIIRISGMNVKAAKLPKIGLKKFQGCFWDCFDGMMLLML